MILGKVGGPDLLPREIEKMEGTGVGKTITFPHENQKQLPFPNESDVFRILFVRNVRTSI